MRCLAKEAGAARPKESMWIPVSGRTGFVDARIQRLLDSSCSGLARDSRATSGATGWRVWATLASVPIVPVLTDRCDIVPVTMPNEIGIGERGVMGAPRSHF